jgi:DNA damage-binding protein 1
MERSCRVSFPSISVIGDCIYGLILELRWCPIENSRRYLLGDAYGRLAMLSLESLDSHGPILLPIGQVRTCSRAFTDILSNNQHKSSAPATLTYLNSQIVFLGSHFGPSHLLRFSTTPLLLPSEPTLPVPDDVKTIEPNQLLLRPKGKGRAEDAEDDLADHEKNGWILSTKGRYFEELETWKNLAPIVDGVCVNTDGSAQVMLDVFTNATGLTIRLY